MNYKSLPLNRINVHVISIAKGNGFVEEMDKFEVMPCVMAYTAISLETGYGLKIRVYDSQGEVARVETQERVKVVPPEFRNQDVFAVLKRVAAVERGRREEAEGIVREMKKGAKQ